MKWILALTTDIARPTLAEDASWLASPSAIAGAVDRRWTKQTEATWAREGADGANRAVAERATPGKEFCVARHIQSWARCWRDNAHSGEPTRLIQTSGLYILALITSLLCITRTSFFSARPPFLNKTYGLTTGASTQAPPPLVPTRQSRQEAAYERQTLRPVQFTCTWSVCVSSSFAKGTLER